MGIRVLTLIEFVIRRSLKQDQVSLKGQVPSLVETPLVSALASGCDECFGIRPPGVRTGPLCFASRGFSLHAATRISADNRQGLEQLCRYVARPALAAGRLRIIDTDQLSFALKTPWSDGTTHLVLSPFELLEKLAALIPPPRLNLIRYHGILAPSCSRPRQDRAGRRKRARGAVRVDPPALFPSPVLVPIAGARVCH
jgi:hypothetical protein